MAIFIYIVTKGAFGKSNEEERLKYLILASKNRSLQGRAGKYQNTKSPKTF
jgi:hypothetical protein